MNYRFEHKKPAQRYSSENSGRESAVDEDDYEYEND